MAARLEKLISIKTKECEDGFRSKFEQYVQKLFTKNLLTAR